ncbi:hypothetical protein GGD68_008554 [Paraburkholderia fungorum]|uniref:Uncharacterized protein n=1 Tax=Paraburkholderia fungorum TaxID=134537 RepID=A0AAW3USB0_9BURK|nr:hypothetical protein [Paraburkholderia fungorum]MBB6201233.1 hypothetical protein [Paraburkholderia fungorum]
MCTTLLVYGTRFCDEPIIGGLGYLTFGELTMPGIRLLYSVVATSTSDAGLAQCVTRCLVVWILGRSRR